MKNNQKFEKIVLTHTHYTFLVQRCVVFIIYQEFISMILIINCGWIGVFYILAALECIFQCIKISICRISLEIIKSACIHYAEKNWKYIWNQLHTGKTYAWNSHKKNSFTISIMFGLPYWKIDWSKTIYNFSNCFPFCTK